ncbi:MAG: IS66 family transposase [Anaerolineales bacterium]
MITREEIMAVYEQGPEVVVTLVEGIMVSFQQQIEQLQAQVKQLQDQLALNSRNSGKPPASDGLKRQTKSLRTPSGKKSGAQPGHPGKALKAVETPDVIERHQATACHHCGQPLADVPGEDLSDRRQVFELPPLRLQVTEHRVVQQTCPQCQTLNCGAFPALVAPGVQYGPSVKALITYWVEEQLLPWQRTSEMFAELFGQPISEGTLAHALAQCADELEDAEKSIKQALIRAEVAHFDESGLYVAGRRDWLHVASTAQLTYYSTHRQRGSQATDEIGILPKFQGRAMHDAWSPYFSYACEHGLCNAHHLRELTFVHEQMQQDWAKELKDLLLSMKDAVAQASTQGATSLPLVQQNEFAARYDQILNQGLALAVNQRPPPTGQRGRAKQSKSKNLLDRLAQRKAETLAFVRDFQVPFDNNQAERDIRMIKTQQKVSGCFRSKEGAQAFCRIRGYISTLKKQGRNVLAALSSVFTGSPLSPLPEG